jgi:hypothetical protein
MAFLRHICVVDRVKKRNALHQYLLQFKMLYNKENGRHMDTNDANDALKVWDPTAIPSYDANES